MHVYNFKQYFLKLCADLKAKAAMAIKYSDLLSKGQQLNLTVAFNHNNSMYQWCSSAAATQLKKDIAQNLHFLMKHKELWASQNCYQKFFIDSFP